MIIFPKTIKSSLQGCNAVMNSREVVHVTWRYLMGIQISGIGKGIPYSEQLPQDRGSAAVQVRSAELQKAAAQALASSTPDRQRVAADVEKISSSLNRKLQFVVDHESHDVTVKVIDPETDKVIKELPPEELQRLRSKSNVKESIGFLFDEEA
jgi:flagellar protein FlaG